MIRAALSQTILFLAVFTAVASIWLPGAGLATALLVAAAFGLTLKVTRHVHKDGWLEAHSHHGIRDADRHYDHYRNNLEKVA